jgi:hypothetical protein
MPGRNSPTAGLEQEPGTTLAFVDPVFDQARGANIAMLVAYAMGLAQARGKRLSVFPQFSEDVQRLDVLRIIVQPVLHSRDMTDRFECRPADLSNTFCDRVGHRKNLVSLLIEQ